MKKSIVCCFLLAIGLFIANFSSTLAGENETRMEVDHRGEVRFVMIKKGW